MNMIDRLIEQLRVRGLSVGPGARPGELLLHGPRENADEAILLALKKFKPDLLARYGLRPDKVETLDGGPPPRDREKDEPPQGPADKEEESCSLCLRLLSREDRERMSDPLMCDRTGSKEVKRNGTVVTPATPRCPYKRAA